MGVFSGSMIESSIDEGTELQNVSALAEAYAYDVLARTPQDLRESFLNSDEAKVAVQEGIITKNTLVRLSRKDDMERRETMAAFQMAKENNDPLWDKLAANRVKERDLIAQIRQKYGNRAKRAAVVGQKEYLKKNKGLGKMFAKITGH